MTFEAIQRLLSRRSICQCWECLVWNYLLAIWKKADDNEIPSSFFTDACTLIYVTKHPTRTLALPMQSIFSYSLIPFRAYLRRNELEHDLYNNDIIGENMISLRSVILSILYSWMNLAKYAYTEWTEWNGKKLSSSQAQLGNATWLLISFSLFIVRHAHSVVSFDSFNR